MTRVKRGTTSIKRRRNILKLTKGYRLGRKSKERLAKQAIFRASQHSFAHRRKKKGDFRKLWQVRINAAAREHGISYSALAGALAKKHIGLNRKMLADLAHSKPEIFQKIVEKVKT